MPKMIRIIVFSGPTEWLDKIEEASFLGKVTKMRFTEDKMVEEILKIRTDQLEM